MPKDRLETFTDRREAIALFDQLRGRDPQKPWPLLPILTFIAPGGSGKSTLIEYLRARKCCLPDGRAALPYAHLDFTLASTPKDLLSILVNIRDQLQQHDDGQGRHLTFPRFDLGALVAPAAPTQEDLSALAPNQVRSKLAAGKQFFESLSALSSALGYTLPYVAPLLAGLKLAGQIKPLQDILLYLENRSGWSWYRTQGTATGLGANAGVKDVLLRLHALSMPGKPEREDLLGQLLPAAFVADLLDALVATDPPRAWSTRANVVLFLDGFEELLSNPGTSHTAIHLLEVLAMTAPCERGETDPLLLVVGSRQHLLEPADAGPKPPFELTRVQDTHVVQEYVRELYTHWQQQLPPDSNFLDLRDLYLPLLLHDFGQEDTQSYLAQFSTSEHQQVFTEKKLVEAVQQVTHGHPLSLALATASLLEAQARGRVLHSDELLQEAVSRKVVPGHQHERIEAYLLHLFLRQLPEPERKDLVFCAAARFLDVAMLRAVLQLSTDIEARERWNRYRHLTFMRAVDDERMVFHPIVRKLLLQQLPPAHELDSDYYRTQSRCATIFRSVRVYKHHHHSRERRHGRHRSKKPTMCSL